MTNNWVAQYLLNEEEKSLKKIIWEEMNKEYLEEQAVKEAAAAARAERACQARLFNGSEEFVSSQKLVAATSAVLQKSRKKRKHSADNKSIALMASSGETSYEHKQKSFSSKINYKVLESLYKDNPKKPRTRCENEEDDNGDKNTIEEKHSESDEAALENGGDLHNFDSDDNDYHYNNEADGYYYEDDHYFGGRDEAYGYDEWNE